MKNELKFPYNQKPDEEPDQVCDPVSLRSFIIAFFGCYSNIEENQLPDVLSGGEYESNLLKMMREILKSEREILSTDFKEKKSSLSFKD